MKGLERPKCPYCGEKPNYLQTWLLRREGEYRCPHCQGISTVTLEFKTPYLAAAAIITALMIYLMLRVIMQQISLWNIVWILIPFLVFYILSIFMVELKQPVMKKVLKRPENQNTGKISTAAQKWSDAKEMDKTKIL